MKFDAGWYPVTLSEGLERGTSTGTHLFGRELVVWRDLEGAAHVWEDRCPHRGMRLSFGFVRGNQIACLYHGWHYDAAGQCRYVPAHPQLTPPDSIKVEVYGSAERAGMVWVWSGQAGDAPSPPEDRAVTPVRSLHVDCPPEKAVSYLSAVMPPPFVAADAVATRFAPISPSFFSISSGRDELLVGIQPIADADTALHIAIAGTADYRGAGQKHFSAWAEDIRRALEGVPGPTSRSEYVIEAAE